MMKEARVSLEELAAVASTLAALAGDSEQAFAFSLPAATATKTPDLDSAETAFFSAVDFDPPSERLATDLAAWCVRTQSTPAITSDVAPSPSQSSTWTPCSRTALATP